MSQTQEKQENRPATERAEELLDRAGRGLGRVVAATGKRVQRATTARPQGAAKPDSLNGKKQKSVTPSRTQEANQEAMERADVLVSQMEQRIRHFTALLGFNIQRTAARVREEAEDMWAEAQHIRSRGRRKS